MAEAKRRGYGEDGIYFDHRDDCRDTVHHRTCSGRWRVWVPITSSTSCDQAIFVDHATDLSLFSDAVQVEVDRLG